MELFVEFMLDPSDLDSILEDLEAIREQVYGAI